MFELLLVIHIIACISIIFFVLLQSGRGAELGAAFGSVGQANSVRGSMLLVTEVVSSFILLWISYHTNSFALIEGGYYVSPLKLVICNTILILPLLYTNPNSKQPHLHQSCG